MHTGVRLVALPIGPPAPGIDTSAAFSVSYTSRFALHVRGRLVSYAIPVTEDEEEDERRDDSGDAPN